jgi:alpha-tubulin suppressor-like RCC1 family protein
MRKRVPVPRWLAGILGAVLVAGCDLAFPVDATLVGDPQIVGSDNGAIGGVGDTLSLSAFVYDSNGGDPLKATGVPLFRWTYPHELLDSISISADGLEALFYARAPGFGLVKAYTVPTPAMPLDSITFLLYIYYPWARVAAGAEHTCAISGLDEVFCWGDTTHGAVGVQTQNALVPRRVQGLKTDSGAPASIVAGDFHTCANLRGYEFSRVWCWGSNVTGQLGNGSSSPQAQPVPGTVQLPGSLGVEAGAGQSCARYDGRLLCWGDGTDGKLGFEAPDRCGSSAVSPCSVYAIEVEGLAGVLAVALGSHHTCALSLLELAYCWGSDAAGQLGDEQRTGASIRPVRVAGNLVLTAITAGATHTCGLTPSGAAYCWGSGSYGELGVPVPLEHCSAVPCSSTPRQVSGGLTFTALSAGDGFTCGIATGGDVYCWGRNDELQLGVLGAPDACGNVECSTVPLGRAISDARRINAGRAHVCVVTQQNQVACWGRNRSGQLGGGTAGQPQTALFVVDPSS